MTALTEDREARRRRLEDEARESERRTLKAERDGYKDSADLHRQRAADIRGLLADEQRLRESRDGMLREVVKCLEHWRARGMKPVWTPYLPPSACTELLRCAGFFGATQLEDARAALSSAPAGTQEESK